MVDLISIRMILTSLFVTCIVADYMELSVAPNLEAPQLYTSQDLRTRPQRGTSKRRVVFV